MSGGIGADTLGGGADNDSLRGNAPSLWGGADLSAQDILDGYASLAGNQAIFEFGAGSLTVDGVTSLDVLADDIGLI